MLKTTLGPIMRILGVAAMVLVVAMVVEPAQQTNPRPSPTPSPTPTPTPPQTTPQPTPNSRGATPAPISTGQAAEKQHGTQSSVEQRRSRLREFLERLDATLDASLAATLAGLALAAGAFASEGLASFRASDAYRRALENSREGNETSSDKAVLKDYDQQKAAVKNLMNAFLVFAACLAINLGVDPIQVLNTDLGSPGNIVDLVGTGTATAVGVGFMVAGAIGIIKRVRD